MAAANLMTIVRPTVERGSREMGDVASRVDHS